MTISPPSDPGFCVFVHYVLPRDVLPRENERDHDHEGPRQTRLESFWENRLRPDLNHAEDILERTRSGPGEVWLFVDRGYADLFARKRAPVKAWERLYFDLGQLKGRLDSMPGISGRVRLVTAHELRDDRDTFQLAMPPRDRGRLREFLTGGGDHLLYDAPKVVEAILRVRNIGRGGPIFRFDDDIFFYGSPARCKAGSTISKRCAEKTAKRIDHLCEWFKRRLFDVRTENFVFSGRCATKNDRDRISEGDLQHSASDANLAINGFATRTLQLASLPNPSDLLEDDYIKPVFDTEAVRLFFHRLHEFGADPRGQVCSGAGFCMSDGAILDLPPFSNMRTNVLWIDDHLKFSLHHELKDFSIRYETMGAAKPPQAIFEQQRYPLDDHGWPKIQPDDFAWHVREYLPRLLMGCVVDSWLRKTPELKKRQTRENHAKVMQQIGYDYARYFNRILLSRGNQHQEIRKELAGKMWKQACQRLLDLRGFFAAEEFDGTFISLFLHGPNGPFQADEHWQLWWGRDAEPSRRDKHAKPSICPDGFGVAVDELRDMSIEDAHHNLTSSGKVKELTLSGTVKDLIDDMIGYVDFVRVWPVLVQALRHGARWHSESHWADPIREMPPDTIADDDGSDE